MYYTVVDCGAAPSLVNGGVSSTSNVFRAVANYTCNLGYRFVSSENTRMCMSNGEWSNQNIQCDQGKGSLKKYNRT